MGSARMGDVTLGATLAICTSLPAFACDVTVFSTCLFNDVLYEVAEENDQWESTLLRVEGVGNWYEMIGLRNGWPHQFEEFTAYTKIDDQANLIRYRAEDLGEVSARLASVTDSFDVFRADHAEGSCTIHHPHETTKNFLNGSGAFDVIERPLSTCDFELAHPIEFYSDAESPYVHYWRFGEKTGSAYSLYANEAHHEDRRLFAFDDGLVSQFVAHDPDGVAVLAFTVLGGTTIGAGEGLGTCEVFK